ncbi:STAS domain-containing protein [Endozoicomonas elysicola]|uniref:STAS domain-containing protein n=1 Tax=Endozoicomonas elysicola TaxID=305900 RepID=UPI000369C0A2|nr:STAS domain-containing protein [Endozoicomonas elysicola]
MSLELVEPGHFKLSGIINFETAPVIELQGRKLLESTSEDRWEISLRGVSQADSSALSVCLSWVRLAREHNKSICFSSMPVKLKALAQVCGIQGLINSVSCLAE